MDSVFRHTRAPVLLFAVLLTGLTACTTRERDLQTPTGPAPVVDGPLHVLRVVRRTTTTGNQPDARSGVVVENLVISCPADTRIAVPIIDTEAFGFGEITPDDLSMVDPATGVISFTRSRANQRPLGIIHSGVTVADIDAPDAAGEQRVTLRARAILADENNDDRWWWAASYTILCLGTPPAG